MRRSLVFLFLSTLAFGQVKLVPPEEGRRALEQLPPSPSPAVQPARKQFMLPDGFAGWKAGPRHLFGPYNAATVAGPDAPLLVEYGYTSAERSEFRKQGQALHLHAFRMKDSSGSYGLFTFYRDETWQGGEAAGAQFARRGAELLLRKQEVFVRSADARLSADDLRQLAGQLGVSGGGVLPTLPGYLPGKGLLSNSGKYILGPVAFDRLVKKFPPVLIDFDLGAEAELARYGSRDGRPVELLLVSYPTPQMAAAKLKEWKQAPNAPGSDPASIPSRRVGPLLALAIRPADTVAADRLLSAVAYESDVTWNERVPKVDEARSWARFLLGVFLLIGVLFLFAVIMGLGFGLLRVVLQRRYPNRFFERLEETEIIQLNINYLPKRS
jgi:hypothetical protein